MFAFAETGKKRRRADRAFWFNNFGDHGCPVDYHGAFRDNIRDFLEVYTEREDYNVQGMRLWSLRLQTDSSNIVTLFIVEEKIGKSLNPHCDHCRCIGWSHHLVCRERFHFLVPSVELKDEPLGEEALNIVGKLVCPGCHASLSKPREMCQICNLRGVQASVLDLPSHLLHGVIHTNGFGHLLCINGRERDSQHVFGRDLMDLWDRICSMLRARQISVEDTAKKRAMELRLLHSVAYGETWFGRWGYKFGHGSYGITEQMHTKAVEAIRGLPTAVMTANFQDHHRILSIVATYQKLSTQVLGTLGDLLRFMLELKARLPYDSKATTKKHPSPLSSVTTEKPTPMLPVEMPCRWSAKRLKLAAQVIVQALKNCNKKWMPRQDVRDAARLYIGDTGLLDFVLKSLGNRVVGDHIVRRAINPTTKVLEYSLEAVSETSLSALPEHAVDVRAMAAETMTRAQVVSDISYVYRHVLERHGPLFNGPLIGIPTAAGVVLDTKQLIKNYRGETTRAAAIREFDSLDETLRVLCYVSFGSDNGGGGRPPAPPDVVVLPPHSTVGDLKRVAQKAFRDTYYAMHDFVAESIVALVDDVEREHNDEEDDELLFGVLESGSTVLVRGSGVDFFKEVVYEGGNDTWTVDCPCGTRDDDGERMIACDECKVWQHTRCVGIHDSDDIPRLFLCERCRSVSVKFLT